MSGPCKCVWMLLNASGVESMRMHVAAVFATQTHMLLLAAGLPDTSSYSSLPWVPAYHR